MLLEVRVIIDSKELGTEDFGEVVKVMNDVIDPTSELETFEVIGIINRGD